MALVDAFTTPATGDSYATVAELDLQLAWTDSWAVLTEPEKEARIKAASAMADRRNFYGKKANDPQSMAFPRTFTGRATTDKVFGLDAQRRKLKAYVFAVVEYYLMKIHVGVIQHDLGDEAVKHTALIEPDEAKMCLWDYWDA